MGIMDWKHWVVILGVVIVVFGTKKLKELGADVGETIKGFRKAMSDDEGASPQPSAQKPLGVQPNETKAQQNGQHVEGSIRTATE